MRKRFIGVPFKADSANGLSESNGIAKFSEAGIVMEFESKLLGFIGGEVKEVQISMDEILDIKFKRGFYKFLSRIQLRLKNISTLSKLPNEGGKVKLKIKREDFELAEKAVEQTLMRLNGPSAKTLDSADSAKGHLPPVQTSVNELFDTEKLPLEESRETNKLDKNTSD